MPPMCRIGVGSVFAKIKTTKNFIIDVSYGSKYTPEVVQDSKINLK